MALFKDENGRNEVEYPTLTGPIDVLAVDQDGALYIFELKRGRSPDAAVGQITRYMAWVRENLADGDEVSGVIVAESIPSKLLHSQKSISNLHLFEYKLSFQLNQAGAST